MPSQHLPPDIRRLIHNLELRVSSLERRIQIGVAVDPGEIIFTLPGALAATESPPVRLRRSANLAAIVANLGTAGTSTTTVAVKRNGVAVVTASLTSGLTVVKAPVAARFGTDQDLMTVAVTAAGTGARNLTVQARFT